VLQSNIQRTRCTTGVWLQHISNLNIVDTEGFDSMERGEDEKIFEKQMSLFCVVVSDIILINLYMDEIGRYTGGHMDILDAIFKVG
jgi:protein SEY1